MNENIKELSCVCFVGECVVCVRRYCVSVVNVIVSTSDIMLILPDIKGSANEKQKPEKKDKNSLNFKSDSSIEML